METIRIFAVARRKDASVSEKVSRKAQKATKEISSVKSVTGVRLKVVTKRQMSRMRRSGGRRRGIKWFTMGTKLGYANFGACPRF